MAKTFSEHAREKLLDLYNHHEHEVGSELKKSEPDKYKTLKSTSCIVYGTNVISYAFEQLGNQEAASAVRRLVAYGHKLSQYLVTSHGWVGLYINPDTVHPADGRDMHAVSNAIINRTCAYYTIPIKYRVVNYAPTPKSNKNFSKVKPKAAITPLDEVGYNALSSVQFGFGISHGGMHTWLFSLGDVYEVHWDEVGADLYERTALKKFSWHSGSIVVPPDNASVLEKGVLPCDN